MTVTAGGDATVTVTNTAAVTTYGITTNVNPAGSGSAICAPNPVNHGGSSACTATANPGYTFANWSGDCAGATRTLTNVTVTKSVTANFTATASKSFTGPTATGTGDATATISGGGASCGFAPTTQFMAASSVAIGLPANYAFPNGLFDFSLTNCAPGSTVTVMIVYPAALLAGAVYWKYGPTPYDHNPRWYQLPGATVTGYTATFSITDGGWGDDDLTANGSIVDQGGPGVPGNGAAADIPTLSEWVMLALAGLLFGYGRWRLRRRESL